MTIQLRTKRTLLALLVAGVFFVGGCGKGEDPGKKAVDKSVVANKDGKRETKHDDWWCKEHGIPEEECSMCSAKVAKECKSKGDWCNKHDRAMTQCFICNPKRKEFYAAKYRAKYGKEPPPIEDDSAGEKDQQKGDKK